MTSNAHPSLPAFRRRVSLTTVAAAAGLTLAGSATVLGGAEFEAVLVPDAPIGDEHPTQRIADANAQGQFVYLSDDRMSLSFVDAAGAEPEVTTLFDEEYRFARINSSGQVLYFYIRGDCTNALAVWSLDAGETNVVCRTFGEQLLGGAAIADDGTVFYIAGEGLFYRWSDGSGSTVIGEDPDPLCPDRAFMEASPGGRAAVIYGDGFFCKNGVGVMDWPDPESPPRLGLLTPSTQFRDLIGINDAGLACVVDGGDGIVYDVEAGAFVDSFDFSPDHAVGMDDNGWIMSSGGTIYRNGGYESLVDLVDGVDAIEHVYTLGENGHCVARVTVGGESMMALIRPSGGTVEGDVTGDGVVNLADLLAILTAWGPCEDCPEDLDGDGQVGFTDLLLVVGNWS